MREIIVTVSDDFMTITPEKRQNAGVMGDENAVKVLFRLTAAYDTYRKRIEFVDVTGRLFTTDEADYIELMVSEGDRTYSLTVPGEWTVYGGTAHISIVAYKTDPDGEVTELLNSPQLPLHFENSVDGDDYVERRSLAQLIVDAHKAEENAKAVAAEIAAKAENGEFDGKPGPQGPMGEKGETGTQGPEGPKGDTGERGQVPELKIGTVITLPPGYTATASISGTAEKPELNLAIPQGPEGQKGDTGEPGPAGPSYTLPAASAQTLGGIKVGNGRTVDENGVLSATSLGITGAAVGQIGRITAVDSDGKPTAWEPVDLPSDKWELIATGTITEDVTFFDISEDMNGEPFKLSRAYICAVITLPATPTNSYVTARYNEKTVCNSIGSGGPPTNIRYYQAIGEITGRTVTVAHSVSYNNYNNILNIYNHSPYYWGNTWKDQDCIYSVGISAGNGVSNQIGANTTYEIYGVKA